MRKQLTVEDLSVDVGLRRGLSLGEGEVGRSGGGETGEGADEEGGSHREGKGIKRVWGGQKTKESVRERKADTKIETRKPLDRPMATIKTKGTLISSPLGRSTPRHTS